MSTTRPRSSPPSRSPGSSRPCSTRTPTACGSARSRPRTACKEIVCGAPNARAGLTTVYAPIGTYIPGCGITLEPRPVRGVVSNGMLCSAAELETGRGVRRHPRAGRRPPVGTPAAEALGAGGGDRLRGHAEPARLAGRRRHRPRPRRRRPRHAEGPVGRRRCRARFPCPIEIRRRRLGRLPGVRRPADPRREERAVAGLAAGRGCAPSACARSTPWSTSPTSSPTTAPGRCTSMTRPSSAAASSRRGSAATGERSLALDGKTYDVTPEMCVIADGSRRRSASAA